MGSQFYIQYSKMISQPKRNVTPSYHKFKRKNSTGRTDLNSEEKDSHDNRASQKSSSKASKCSFEVYEKRVLNLSKLKNTLNLVRKPDDDKKHKRISSIQKQADYGGYVERENLVFTGHRLSLNGSNLAKKRNITNTSSNTRLKSKEKTSAPKRDEESLEKEEERAKLQNTELLTNLMKHQHVPNYMNKLKIKKQDNNVLSKKQGLIHTQTLKPKKRFFEDPSIELKSEEALSKYQLHGQLGKGAYGIVRIAIDRITKQKYAVKIYEKNKLDEPNKIKNIEREISILTKLSHPVIYRIIETIENSSEIYLVLEYSGANSLYKYLLSKHQHRLTEKQAKTFFKSVAQAIQYLHKRNIVHRDIKAQNILLNRYKQLKLIDFGFSLVSKPPETIDTFCGTPTYMAPEIVSKRDHVAQYTDLWSLGILYYVMVQGNYPFRAKSESELFEKIRKGNYEFIHDDISDKSKQLIKILLQVNPLQRASIDQILDKQWSSWYQE